MRSSRILALAIGGLAMTACQGGRVASGPSGERAADEPAPGSAAPGGEGDAGSGPMTASGLPKLPERGGLSYEIIDDATGARMPGKLTFVGVRSTPEPRLSHGDIGREDGTQLAAYNRVFALGGLGVVELATGTYDVTVSRGPEWTIATQRIVLPKAGAELHAHLRHVVDTPGWASADFHVHAASSPDSRVPMRDRVYEFVADGVDMIVSTDHNVVSNYQPVIADLGAEHLLASATGDEVTTGDWGHFGAFPLPHEMESEGHGAIPVRKKTPAEIFAAIRLTAPGAVIDVHHPRLEQATGYFLLGKFDDQKDTSTRKGFSYDFDAIEILNGYQDTNRKSIERVMVDWFALLDRGHLVTATGNSDTHHMTYNLGGYPRNYVLVEHDAPGAVLPDEVARGVKAHHAYFTTGPIVAFSVGGVGIGDLAPAPSGKATADITVRAAPWISVSRVILYVAGKEVKRWEVAASDRVDRFHQTYDLEVAGDTYAIVRVEGDGSLAPVVGGKDVTVHPFALTNPILLDANGNGKYDPAIPHGAHHSE